MKRRTLSIVLSFMVFVNAPGVLTHVYAENLNEDPVIEESITENEDPFIEESVTENEEPVIEESIVEEEEQAILEAPSSIANGKTVIENGEFKNANLNSLTIPSSIVTIKEKAFENATINTLIFQTPTNLHAETLASLAQALYNANIKEIKLSSENGSSQIWASSGVLYSKDKKKLIYYPRNKAGASFTIPSSVTTIGVDAFQYNNNLKALTIPLSVTSIQNAGSGHQPFFNTKQLTDIYYNGTTAQWRKISGYTQVARPSGLITIHCMQGTGGGSSSASSGSSSSSSKKQVKPAIIAQSIPMYRLYNPNSGEHFYSASVSEKNYLCQVGWKDEGIGWYAPKVSSAPVYRLYNPNGATDHHYTMSLSEKNYLVEVGWRYEGIGWYSNDENKVPLYRQYNPNAASGSHNYTTSKGENDWLVSIGWRPEGVGWYGQ